MTTNSIGGSLSLRLGFNEPAGLRRSGEPVTFGIPLLRGKVFRAEHLVLIGEDGPELPLQTQPLAYWPDGSLRWVLCDSRIDIDPFGSRELAVFCGERVREPKNGVHIQESFNSPAVNTGPLVARLNDGLLQLNLKVDAEKNGKSSFSSTVEFLLTQEEGSKQRARVVKSSWETRGPLRATLLAEAEFQTTRDALLCVFARIHLFAGLSVLKVDVTLRNPQPAKHIGGLWDLGDPSSVYFRDLSVCVTGLGSSETSPILEEVCEGKRIVSQGSSLKIYQDSSGGENWRSRNHVNRYGRVCTRFRGYQVSSGDRLLDDGYRASPVLTRCCGSHALVVGVREFWENFPKALEATDDGIRISLFPAEFGDFFELQGGEQKTHTFLLEITGSGDEGGSVVPGMTHSPLIPDFNPSDFAATGVVSGSVPDHEACDAERRKLLNVIVEGENSFEKRREIIDEFGWRNFGDFYSDHESAERRDGMATISHYNNQYDAIKGLFYRWVTSADQRWYKLMDELARHVIDIDIYHTAQDAPKTSGGLFWHTDHYTEAETATHRTFSRINAAKRGRSYGGGPSNEHNYTTGLLLYYYLTGNPLAREVVTGLSDWVIAMDDGRLTHWSWLDKRPTGLASSTVSRFYHGPGRGAGNSINALLDSHALTGDRRYLEKAEELMRRCIHPRDDIGERDLASPECQWSYLVFLQVLGRYLEHKLSLGEEDSTFDYARLSLLHYAAWVSEYERPYKEVLHKVEKPTETWPAHDIRKGDVLCLAAIYADSQDARKRYLERADEFYCACLRDVQTFPSWTLTRPLVILLTSGWLWAQMPYVQELPIRPLTPVRDGSRPANFRFQFQGIHQLHSRLSS